MSGPRGLIRRMRKADDIQEFAHDHAEELLAALTAVTGTEPMTAEELAEDLSAYGEGLIVRCDVSGHALAVTGTIESKGPGATGFILLQLDGRRP